MLIGWGTLGLQALGIDRALWIGTPEVSRWMHEVVGEPRPDVDKTLVARVNDYEQFCDLGAEEKEHIRYVLLSHDNDGVTRFGPGLSTAVLPGSDLSAQTMSRSRGARRGASRRP